MGFEVHPRVVRPKGDGRRESSSKENDLSHTDLMTHVKDIEKRAFRKM